MAADCHEAARDAHFAAFILALEVCILFFDFRGMMIHVIAMAERGNAQVGKSLHLLAADFEHLVFVLLRCCLLLVLI